MYAEEALTCTHSACVFVTVNKAGLTNHTHQKHVLLLKSMCHSASNYFINRVFTTTEDIVTRDHIQHNVLAFTTPTTCGKWSAYSIWM